MAAELSGVYTRTFVFGGVTFGAVTNPTASFSIPWGQTIAPAKIGQLTTRTSNTAGTLTMNAGHGFTNGQRIDIYWSGGAAYAATIGTVSTNSVPFTGAAGTNLPANNTAITAIVPYTGSYVVTGNNVAVIAASCPQGGIVVFADVSNVTLFAITILPANATSYVYSSTDGGTNPLAGAAVANLFLSQGNANQSSILTGLTMYN